MLIQISLIYRIKAKCGKESRILEIRFQPVISRSKANIVLRNVGNNAARDQYEPVEI
jgi:hypothetical protein